MDIAYENKIVAPLNFWRLEVNSFQLNAFPIQNGFDTRNHGNDEANQTNFGGEIWQKHR